MKKLFNRLALATALCASIYFGLGAVNSPPPYPIAEYAWANAPTGAVDLTITRQYISTFTSISITGFLNKSPSFVQPVTLKVKNAAATNITLYLPANFIDLNFGTSYVITNGLILTLEYDPLTGTTNGIARAF